VCVLFTVSANPAFGCHIPINDVQAYVYCGISLSVFHPIKGSNHRFNSYNTAAVLLQNVVQRIATTVSRKISAVSIQMHSDANGHAKR